MWRWLTVVAILAAGCGRTGLLGSAATLDLGESPPADLAGRDLATPPGSDLAMSPPDLATPPPDLTTPPPRFVFVSSALFNANLGGLDGADHQCQLLADARGLDGSYKAWLSDDTGSPSTRFTHSDGLYVLVDGTVVANGWRELTSGVLSHAITLTERGTRPPATDARTTCNMVSVWSNTEPNGTWSRQPFDCARWTTTTAVVARFGEWTTATFQWSFFCDNSVGCSARAPLFCVQQ